MTYEHEHGHRHRRGRERFARYARSRRFRDEWERREPADRLAYLEEHRRDVEEYLADLSDRIRRLRDKVQGNIQDEVPASARQEASPEPW